MTAQEVKHAICKDPNRIISVTALGKGDQREENYDKQQLLIEEIKSNALHRIYIDRSAKNENHIGLGIVWFYLSFLMPFIRKLIP